MIKDQIEKIINGKNLKIEEAKDIMLQIMTGEVNQAHMTALLIALRCKGETHQELAGFAKAMREKSIKVETDLTNHIDVCGTGGDHSGTFNISTAAAFVVAAAGVPVAKHGNRSISSSSGSADVLKELGANINLSPEQSAQALEEIGLTFLFAPDYHPAMKHVAPVRKELGMKTIFNILGPLTNPAGTRKQLIGTFSDNTAELMSKAAKELDMDKVCFICTDNRFDEVLLSQNTRVFEYNSNSEIKDYMISNHTFGYPEVNISEIKGDSPAHNADILKRIFEEKNKDGAYYVTCANTAMALYTSGFSIDLTICKEAAEDAILSGKAAEKLAAFIAFGKSTA